MTATGWPSLEAVRAGDDPTRPQPMITMCTTCPFPGYGPEPCRAVCSRLAIPYTGRVRRDVSPARCAKEAGPWRVGSRRVQDLHELRPSVCWSVGRSAATGWRTPCCPSASRCRSSRPTHCPASRTRRRRSSLVLSARRADGVCALAVGGRAGVPGAWSSWSPPTGRTCTPTPRAAATTRSSRRTSGPNAGVTGGERAARGLRPDGRGLDRGRWPTRPPPLPSWATTRSRSRSAWSCWSRSRTCAASGSPGPRSRSRSYAVHLRDRTWR